MHLRWIYVKDHAPLFVALAALFVAGLVSSALLVPDPARGLLLGILPTAFAIVVWALTNRAGYPDRAPASLPHQRTEGSQEEPEAAGWDPFDRERPDVEETVGEETSGDSESDAPAQVPAEPPTAPSSKAPSEKARPRPDSSKKASAEAAPPPAAAKGPQPTKSDPKQDGLDQKAGATGGRVPGRRSKAASKEAAAPATADKATSSRASSEPLTSGSASKNQPRTRVKSGRSRAKPESAGLPDRGGRLEGSSDPFMPDAPAPKSTSAASDRGTEQLTPAEAAIRDAAARKQRKRRKGSTDPA